MTREKVVSAINDIKDNYHFTQIDGKLGDKYFSNNLALMSLSYVMDRNHLLIGDPGWGKTTVAQILSSRFSGSPFDLYESLTVEGHPGLFTEKWKARPHYGSLTQGEEKVIWQGGFGLDTFIVDEINRVSPDVQDEMLEGIRTGRWTYMNDTLYEGKKPSFFTMNDRDNGNGDIIPPLEDRIDIVTEERANSPLNDYAGASRKVQEMLANYQVTTDALSRLKSLDFAGFKETVHKNKQGSYITGEEKRAMQDSINAMPLTNDAWYFLWTFAAELNFSQKYGTKRAGDPISDDEHDKKYAGIHVKNGFSARPQIATQVYAKGLAWLLGDEKVELDHVRYVLPFTTAHKLDFNDGFRDAHGNDHREDYEKLHLASALVDTVQEHYEESVKPLKNIVSQIQNGKIKAVDRAKGTIKVGKETKHFEEYDHPFIRHLIQKKVLEPSSNLV